MIDILIRLLSGMFLCLIIIVPLLIIFGGRFFKSKIKGVAGEMAISLILNTLPKDRYSVLNNIMLNTEFGTTQIDHIVVSWYGIFVIETKNYKGWIYGSDASSEWTQVLYRVKNHFMNPIHQNYKHCMAIKQLLNNSSANIVSVVAFPNNATLNITTNNLVVYYSQIRNLIESFTIQSISYEEWINITNTILQNNISDKDTRRNHVASIKERAFNDSIKVQNNICPKCGGQLVQRMGRYGYFIGCSNYPKCKYIFRR